MDKVTTKAIYVSVIFDETCMKAEFDLQFSRQSTEFILFVFSGLTDLDHVSMNYVECFLCLQQYSYVRFVLCLYRNVSRC